MVQILPGGPQPSARDSRGRGLRSLCGTPIIHSVLLLAPVLAAPAARAADDEAWAYLEGAWRPAARVLEPWLYHESRRLRAFTPEDMVRRERRFLD